LSFAELILRALPQRRSAISDAQQELSMNAYAGSPLETPVAAAAGVLALALAWFVLRGAHGLTLLSGATRAGCCRANSAAPGSRALHILHCRCFFPLILLGLLA
jgi:hypothetical protein